MNRNHLRLTDPVHYAEVIWNSPNQTFSLDVYLFPQITQIINGFPTPIHRVEPQTRLSTRDVFFLGII